MKHTIKRLTALLCAVMLLLGLSGCKAAPAGDPPTVTDPVAPVTDPVTPAAEPVTPEKLQELFATGGWYAQALTSTYEDPRDVDLVQMFYNGGGRQVTQEEYDYVQRQLDGPDTDVMAVSPAEMDAALTEVFGLTLEETNKKGLDGFIFWEETGNYYLCHGDTNIMTVTFTDVQNLGEGCFTLTYEGWDGTYHVELRLGQTETNAGHVYIISHTKAE